MRTYALGFFVGVSFLLGTNLPAWSAPSEPAVITDQKDEWQNVYGFLYYRVIGHVKNTSGQPLKYVKLEFEVLGPDGKVLAHQTGYNQKAQFLAEEKEEGAGAAPEEANKEPEAIAPGSNDYFGVGITKGDLPKKTRFTSYCVKVVEAPPVKGAASKDLKFTPQCVKIQENKPAAPGEKRLNINTATEEDLMKLPNMTTARAKAILVHRKGHEDFIQLRELQMIPQVSPIYDQMKDKLSLE